MKRFVLLLLSILVLVLGGCSGSDDGAYQRGYEEGYAVGRQTSLEEGKKLGEQTAEATEEAAKAEGYRLGYSRGYNNGFEEGSTEGHNKGFEEGSTEGYNRGFEEGYNEGFEEATQSFELPDELVKILSYKFSRGLLDWLTVNGELKNISNKSLYVKVTCAVLDSNDEIIATSSYPWRERIEPQKNSFFSLDFHEKLLDAIDARFTIVWDTEYIY